MRLRQLLPEPRESVDPADVYAAPVAVRPDTPGTDGARAWVRANMVASRDGCASLHGTSGGLGNEADRAIFQVLRSMADAVLVAAGTVRAEGYGPARSAPDGRPIPIAVVSLRLDLDWGSPFFTEAEARPIVVTAEGAAPDVMERASEVAELLVVGEGAVDLEAAVTELGRRGLRHVLCEGGPTFLGSLVAAGLVDELCLTTAPLLVGEPTAPRLLGGATLPQPVPLELLTLCESDGAFFARYRLG